MHLAISYMFYSNSFFLFFFLQKIIVLSFLIFSPEVETLISKDIMSDSSLFFHHFYSKPSFPLPFLLLLFKKPLSKTQI